MKLILLFIFSTLVFSLSFSQFNRSYGNITTTSNSYFSNFFHISKNNKKLFTNMYVSQSMELILTTQEIDEEGEVVRVQNNIYLDPLFTNDLGYVNSISGIFDKGSHRYYVFIIESGSRVRLAWLKTDIQTGNLEDIQFSENHFVSGYIETKLIGDEMVIYLTNGDQLKRIAMSMNDFGNTLVEDVTIHNFNHYDIEKGKRMGYLLELEGKEYYVNTQSSNDRNLLIFRRESKDVYTQISLNQNYQFKTTIGTTVFINDDNHIVITDGEVLNIVNAEGNYINTIDLGLDISSNSDPNFVFLKDQKYYIIYTTMTSSTSTLLVVDKDFNKLEERKIDKIFVNRIVEHQESYFLDGIITGESKYVSKPDIYFKGHIPYLESFEDTPILRTEEYYNAFDFQNCDLNMNIGLGSRAFSQNYDKSAIKYQNEQNLARELFDNYVGIDSDDKKFGNTLIYFTGTSELPGPSTNYEDYDEVEEAKYNRSYHINRQMIVDHLDSVQYGSSNYKPVWEIRKWPGNGKTSKGQAKKLADFVDHNKNGVYEPMKGDYPLIYGDECIFSISHYWDQGNENRKVEFHSYIYHFDCDTSSTFRNVLFRKLKVISRGADLDEFYMGVYQEGDIGGRSDDFMGTNPDLGMTYFYNATSPDLSGFGDRLAAAGTMILRGFKNKDNGLDDNFGVEENESINGLGFGDGIIDNEYNGLAYSVPFYEFNGGPDNKDGTTPAYWFYPEKNLIGWVNNFKGLTGAGNPTTYGGLGYGGTVPTKYVFPWEHDTYQFGTAGNQPPFVNWSEMNTDGSGTSNTEGDRKILSSFGETSLSLGDTISVDYAFLFARDAETSASITSPLQLLFEKGDSIRNAFLSNELSCGRNFDGVFVKMPPKKPFVVGELNVFPNPSNGQYKIKGISEFNEIMIYNLSGALVEKIKDYQIGEIIDLNHLRGGIYLFHIQDEYQMEVIKVIKI